MSQLRTEKEAKKAAIVELSSLELDRASGEQRGPQWDSGGGGGGGAFWVLCGDFLLWEDTKSPGSQVSPTGPTQRDGVPVKALKWSGNGFNHQNRGHHAQQNSLPRAQRSCVTRTSQSVQRDRAVPSTEPGCLSAAAPSSWRLAYCWTRLVSATRVLRAPSAQNRPGPGPG